MLEKVLVSVQRPVRVSNGAGGKTETLESVATGLLCRQTHYGQNSVRRFEDVGSSVPGGATVRMQLFCFYAEDFGTWPDIRTEDLVTAPDGSVYKVLFTRGYPTTFQVDTERVS